MSNLEKWIKAILQEDVKNLSIGSVRTLQMIKQEFERLQKENKELKAESETPLPTQPGRSKAEILKETVCPTIDHWIFAIHPILVLKIFLKNKTHNQFPII